MYIRRFDLMKFCTVSPDVYHIPRGEEQGQKQVFQWKKSTFSQYLTNFILQNVSNA